jgi:hypothetical protein
MEDHNQLLDYARAVSADERFNKVEVDWQFWLVGNAYDDALHQTANQSGRPAGLAMKTDQFEIHVKPWSDVLNVARHRLKFVKKELVKYEPTDESALDHVRRLYSAFIPEAAKKVDA